MSFPKCLICDGCKKYFNISEEKFPEDLYDLIQKYDIQQLIWLCKSCKAEKDKAPCSLNTLMCEVKNNGEELKNIHDFLMTVNDSIRSIQATKTFDLRKVDDLSDISINSSGFYDSVDGIGSSYETSLSSANTSFLGNISPTNSDIKLQQLADINSPANNSAHKILSQILKDVKPPEDEAKECRQVVGNFMNNLIEKLKEDQEFKCLYSQPYYTGSSYNELRISSATEYDIDIILKAPPEISLEVEFLGKSKAFAKIKWKKSKELSEKEQNILKWFEKRSEPGGIYLDPEKINSWFQSILSKCLNKNITFEGAKLSQSGPAKTIRLNCASGKWIDLDLVPVFQFNYSIFSKDEFPEVLAEYEVIPDKEMCLLVPKPLKAGNKLNLSQNIKSVFRLDLPEVEKAILRRKMSAKCVIKLLKLLRDNMDWKGIASYYLKTIVMLKIQDNPSVDYWKHTFLYERFMEALEELKTCLENQTIECFFSREYNLIYQLNKDQCINWSNKVKNFIQLINSDVNSFNKILKVK